LDHYQTAARPERYARSFGGKSRARDYTCAGPFMKFDHFGWHFNFFSVVLFLVPSFAAARRLRLAVQLLRPLALLNV
jgi:hypothetical protein